MDAARCNYGIDPEVFLSIVDSMYDELLIYDGNYNIVYINQACCRHYSCTPAQMIGKNFFDFVNDNWWAPSILPIIYREKRAYAIKQKTYIGSELLTIAVPIFNDKKEIEYVVMNVRDNINSIDLYNPQYISLNGEEEKEILPVCESEAMENVLRQVKKVAKHGAPCLITGEVGVGKTVIAKYLHSISSGSTHPLYLIDCAHVPDGQLEQRIQEFFSNGEPDSVKNNCTLLLCNVSQLSLKAQTYLLQLFPSNTKGQTANIRILATSSKNLVEMIKSGQFLEDLYYSLNVSDIYVPPLRKRREDIRPLVYSILQNLCSRYAVTRQFTEGVIQAMINAEWVRNVSEMKYMIERLVVMSDSMIIDVDQLPTSIFGIMDITEPTISCTEESFDEKMDKFEYFIIYDAFQKYGTSRKIAEHLGLSQTRANNLIRKHIHQFNK